MLADGWEISYLYSAFPPNTLRGGEEAWGPSSIKFNSLRLEFYEVVSLLGTLGWKILPINPGQRLGLVGVSRALSLTGKFERKLWKKSGPWIIIFLLFKVRKLEVLMGIFKLGGFEVIKYFFIHLFYEIIFISPTTASPAPTCILVIPSPHIRLSDSANCPRVGGG